MGSLPPGAVQARELSMLQPMAEDWAGCRTEVAFDFLGLHVLGRRARETLDVGKGSTLGKKLFLTG